MSSDKRLMKDSLGVAAIERIAANFRRVWRKFPDTEFIADASDGLSTLELKQRVRHVTANLAKHLPQRFEPALDVVLCAGREWPRCSSGDPLEGFAAWPMIDFVGAHGLDHPNRSLDALRELTPLFTSEFAIRPFLKLHFGLTIKMLAVWTNDPDEHVRRLVSEGTRPRLPWGERLSAFVRDPKPVLTLIEKLRDDDSEYVRRSVANNLNDISKDHPNSVIETCTRWRLGASENRQWVIRHATRSLVKSRHPGVWGLLGYADPPLVTLRRFHSCPESIELGNDLLIEVEIQSDSNEPQRLVIDYAVHHIKANGGSSPKVFKLKTSN